MKFGRESIKENIIDYLYFSRFYREIIIICLGGVNYRKIKMVLC